MFDWDKIVIDVDNNIVDLTAGEVALLIAADADTVTWGNITGDMAQQADLMLELDSKIDVDSPEFTGTPRTPTPPAGNSSTRIANTKFVSEAIDAVIPDGGFGDLAGKDKVDFYTDIVNKPQNMPSNFGTLASKSYVDYRTDVTYKPTLGALASKDTVNYETEVTNKPTIPVLPANTPASFGTLASKNSVDYETEVYNKPENPEVTPLEFYVDNVNGDDNNDGTALNPLKTIQKAIDKTVYYGTIQLLNQLYTESLVIYNKHIVLINSSSQDEINIYCDQNKSYTVITVQNDGYLELIGKFSINAQFGSYPIWLRRGSRCWVDSPLYLFVHAEQGDSSSALLLNEGSSFICQSTVTIRYSEYISNIVIGAVTAYNGSYVSIHKIEPYNCKYMFRCEESTILYGNIETGDYDALFPPNQALSRYSGIVDSYNKNPCYLYVANSGSDKNNGSQESPLQNIQRAIDLIPENGSGTIVITPGDYSGYTLEVTNNKHVVFESANRFSSDHGTVKFTATRQNASFVRAIEVYDSSVVFSGYFHLVSLKSAAVYAVNSTVNFTYTNAVHFTYILEIRGVHEQGTIPSNLIRATGSTIKSDGVVLYLKTADDSDSAIIADEFSNILIESIQFDSKFSGSFISRRCSEIVYGTVTLGTGVDYDYTNAISTATGGKVSCYLDN